MYGSNFYGSDQSCSVSKKTFDLTATRIPDGSFGSKVPILLYFVEPKRPSGNY